MFAPLLVTSWAKLYFAGSVPQTCVAVLTCRCLVPAQILQKDQEIKDLKQKIAEVMAVMPSISYSTDTNSVTPHYSSKFMDTNPSGLDPNASIYQPLKK